jgi:NADP-dependent 3-hydroxy acid dehydrogenase YdfG
VDWEPLWLDLGLGCNVILCGRSLPALDSMAGHIESRTGYHPQKFVFDLADPISVETAAKDILTNVPVVDVLINNGAAWLGGRETPYEAREVMSAINSALTGTFLFTQALIPALQKSTRPDVVTIGSISGLTNVSLSHLSSVLCCKHGRTL